MTINPSCDFIVLAKMFQTLFVYICYTCLYVPVCVRSYMFFKDFTTLQKLCSTSYREYYVE